ncbi:MAG: PIN domain-containing protein [Leptospiraceae bacterium]|nr:PIN domain-containing protein [Leptospiraceae bacterium]MCP5493996.1 PIN domain-containing protein [Leptospiraceae bacterium]
MKIYLDSAIIIYLIEDIIPYSDKIKNRLSNTGIELFASELSRLECRMHPIKTNNLELLQDYDLYFQSNIFDVLQLSRNVMEKATEIRAKYSFKTPDAIHLAISVINNCEIFLTNDLELKKFSEISIETL